MPRGRKPKNQINPEQVKQKTQDKVKTDIDSSFTLNETENKWKKVFASSSGFLGSSGNGMLGNFFMNTGSVFMNDPYLLNQRIKQLKTMSKFMGRDEIEEALKEPEYNEFALRTATHSMLNMTYPLYKLQMLYEGILTYHSYVYPKYVDKEDFNTPRFQSDDKFMDMWLKKLNPQKQFRRITEEVLAEGKRAYYIRQSYKSTTGKEQVDYVHFQELPSDWYKIVKKSSNSHYVVAFNFAYFWQAGTSLGQFPPIFSQYYNEMMGATTVDDNNNILGIDNLKTPNDVVVEYNNQTMKWFYWKELPDDECFVFSFDESNPLQISPFVSLLLPAQDLNSYSLLQQQLLAVPLYSIILGEIPLFDENANGEYDAYKLSPDATKLFEYDINSKMPPGTSFSMTPTTNNQMYKFQEIPNANKIFLQGLQQLISNAGVNGLLSTSDKPSVAMVNASKITETRFIDRLYDQYKHACNIILDNMFYDNVLKYKWRLELFGDSYSDSNYEQTLMKDLSMGQKELFPRYLAMHNQTLSDADDYCNYVDSYGIYNKFDALINSYTAKVEQVEQTNGRPQIDENEVDNENTANAKDQGSNTKENRAFSMECKCIICGKEINKDSEYFPMCDECGEQFVDIHTEVESNEDE